MVGLVSAGIAVIHRILRIERLFGLIETAVPTEEMLTTFVNPNHASGFMVLCAAVAIGLAHAADLDRAAQTGWRLAAVVCTVVALGLSSKGGVVALAVAVIVYSVKRWGDGYRRHTAGLLVAPLAIAVVAGFALWESAVRIQ